MTAKTTARTVAQLKKLNLESPHYWKESNE